MPKISEEQKQSRRLEILDVATRCFARQGFHRTTMNVIIGELQSSPGAVYCYFRGKDDIIAAIAEKRHNRESALLTASLATENISKGLEHLARKFFAMLQDPEEMERRKVTIQLWAESLRNKRIRKIIERGIQQRVLLTDALRRAQGSNQLPRDLDVDAFSRVLLGLLQGFILQQAWEPDLDLEAYLATAMHLIKSVFKTPGPESIRTTPRRAQPR